MSNRSVDIATMLDDLNLPVAALRWKELVDSPALADYTAPQLFREVLEPQYIETMDTRYKTNLRLSKLIDKSALVENLVTSDKRRYNDTVVQQLLSFHFAEERLNIGVYGITDAGKSYFMSAFCNEACHRNYRCMFVDYCDLLDELLTLSRCDNLDRYRKKLKYYARIQILFIDDFAISRYSEEGIKILYHLIKTRTDLKTTTMFTSQYAPSEWGKYLSDEENCYGKLDGIRRRLTTGYTVHIEKL